MKAFCICEAPISVGSPTRGSEDAFAALRQAGAFDRLAGAIFCRFEGERTAPDTLHDPRLRDFDTVMQVNRRHYRHMAAALADGRFAVSIGGDHSIAMADIAAAANAAGADRLAVIYVDGHTDINTEKTTLTGYIHGMPLAAALGLCDPRLRVNDRPYDLLPANLYIVGARSIDPAETRIIEEQGIYLATASTVKTRGAQAVADEVIAAVGDRPTLLCFDVDVIDGAAFPATGYVMPDGLSIADTETLLQAFIGRTRLVSFECVEYNPHRDPDGQCRRTLERMLALLA